VGSETRLNPNAGRITAGFWDGRSYYDALQIQIRRSAALLNCQVPTLGAKPSTRARSMVETSTRGCSASRKWKNESACGPWRMATGGVFQAARASPLLHVLPVILWRRKYGTNIDGAKCADRSRLRFPTSIGAIPNHYVRPSASRCQIQLRCAADRTRTLILINRGEKYHVKRVSTLSMCNSVRSFQCVESREFCAAP